MYDDTVISERYTMPSQAFGAGSGTATKPVIGPKGRKGIVRDISVEITASMVGTTTVPEICVGTSSGDASYARFRLGTTATSGYTTSPAIRRATQVAGYKGNGTKVIYEDYAGHVKLNTDYLPADTVCIITAKEGTGGSPAGTGVIHVDIDWI